jgi:MoxR-like ATPase
VLSYEALTDDITADAVLKWVMGALPVPEAPMRERPLVR